MSAAIEQSAASGETAPSATSALRSESSTNETAAADDMSAAIFISYARPDRRFADSLAARLTAAGFSVWWDRQIRGGHHFDQVTEAAIRAARLVIVIWSERSVASNWVRAEAAWALDDSKLLPVKIGEVRPPLRFIQVQTLNLVGWDGDADADELGELVREVGDRLGEPPAGTAAAAPRPIAPKKAPAAPPSTGKRKLAAVAIAAGLLAAVAVGAIAFVTIHPTAPARSPPPAAASVPPAAASAAPPAPSAPAPAPAISPTIGDPIYFERGSVTFSAGAHAAISAQAAMLKANPGMLATIDGYALPGEGAPGTLQALAELRARKVQRELGDGGVDGGRLTIAAHIDESAAGQAAPRVVVTRR